MTPVNPQFGSIYGDPSGGPQYITDSGVAVWMWRKGVQVGPEHRNVAPAVCAAAAAGWTNPSMPAWLNAGLAAEVAA